METSAQPRRVGPAAREAIFAQLADAGRAEQVAQRLTDAIILGVLEPGERLPSEPELARRFGVALITVREGLGVLRESALVHTRRGRDGGSFVTDAEAHGSIIESRLRALGLVELSDMAVYFGTILTGCAERAAERSTDEEAQRLLGWLHSAEFGTAASARSNAGGFFLEVAVLSQSARLVREQIRVQAEFGPLLLLTLDDDAVRLRMAAGNVALADAIRVHDVRMAHDRVGEQVEMLSTGLAAVKAALLLAEARQGGREETDAHARVHDVA